MLGEVDRRDLLVVSLSDLCACCGPILLAKLRVFNEQNLLYSNIELPPQVLFMHEFSPVLAWFVLFLYVIFIIYFDYSSQPSIPLLALIENEQFATLTLVDFIIDCILEYKFIEILFYF